MNISLFGLGYVGVVSAACLAEDGHSVLGVDPLASKVDMINRGQSPIVEKDIGPMVEKQVALGRLRATRQAGEAVQWSDLSMVCVGTPSLPNGALDLSHVEAACAEIGLALAHSTSHHTVVIRSTMLPGSLRDLVIPTLEKHSGKRAGEGFGVCINPEFLREGSAVWDYRHPALTIIGHTDETSAQTLASLYAGVQAPLVKTQAEMAEMVKYTSNIWHALKVSFANEIGHLCKKLGLDGHALMDTFCMDQKLNLSASYLKPGFAFGGSCLPKDLRALHYKARSMDLDLPLLAAILPSNERQVERGYRMIRAQGRQRIGFVGLSFKSGTDDLRESPLVEVIERLLGKGHDIRVFDRFVQVAALTGSNRDYILHHIPHVGRLLADTLQEVIDHAEVLVIGHATAELEHLAGQARPGQVVLDWARMRAPRPTQAVYEGIAW
jgi:GDP-mannose 6-dehydrogenase